MGKVHDVFIERYKELENLLDQPVREYEDVLATTKSDKIAERLRLCRYLRNYIAHNADYEQMITITPGMQSFLDQLVQELHERNGVIKDHMMTIAKYGKLTSNDTLLDAATLMTKKKRTDSAVFDAKTGEYIGHITKADISDLFGTGEITKATKISKFTDKLVPVSGYMSVLSAITMDEMKKIGALDSFVFVKNKAGNVVGIYDGR